MSTRRILIMRATCRIRCVRPPLAVRIEVRFLGRAARAMAGAATFASAPGTIRSTRGEVHRGVPRGYLVGGAALAGVDLAS
jgi:hypothetical protein